MNILILEENKKYLSMMTNVLNVYGELHIYTNFNKCIIDVRNKGNKYDLAILDLDLPEGSTLNLLKELRAENSAMKVLLLSAKKDISSMLNLFSLPEDIFLTKTNDKNEFINYLKKYGCI